MAYVLARVRIELTCDNCRVVRSILYGDSIAIAKFEATESGWRLIKDSRSLAGKCVCPGCVPKLRKDWWK